jgi:hypothetical protein
MDEGRGEVCSGRSIFGSLQENAKHLVIKASPRRLLPLYSETLKLDDTSFRTVSTLSQDGEILLSKVRNAIA